MRCLQIREVYINRAAGNCGYRVLVSTSAGSKLHSSKPRRVVKIHNYFGVRDRPLT